MKNAKIPTKAALVACFVIASAAAVHAQLLLNVNIAPTGGNGQAVLGGTTDTYNNFGQSGYNPGAAAAGLTLFTNAVSSTGANTGVAISTSTGFNTYTDNGNNGPINPHFLMDGYAFNFTGNGFNGPATTNFTMSGLTAYDGKTFTLVVYAVGNNPGEGNTLTLSGASTATGLTTGANRDISSGAGVAYQTFTGTITGDTLTIAAGSNTTYAGDFSNGVSDGVTEVNGFQLQISAVPEPGTAAAGAVLMGMALLRFRRRISTFVWGACA